MLDELETRGTSLWLAAVLLYGVGDTVTTFYGLSIEGVEEAGPIAGFLIYNHGSAAFLLAKLGVFAVFYVVWLGVRTPARLAVPLALVVVGGVVTGWNLYTIVSAT